MTGNPCAGVNTDQTWGKPQGLTTDNRWDADQAYHPRAMSDSKPILAEMPTDALLAHKDQLARRLLDIIKAEGLPIAYPYLVVRAAKERRLDALRYQALLEIALELESAKYVLAARRLREIDPDADAD